MMTILVFYGHYLNHYNELPKKTQEINILPYRAKSYYAYHINGSSV